MGWQYLSWADPVFCHVGFELLVLSFTAFCSSASLCLSPSWLHTISPAPSSHSYTHTAPHLTVISQSFLWSWLFYWNSVRCDHSSSAPLFRTLFGFPIYRQPQLKIAYKNQKINQWVYACIYICACMHAHNFNEKSGLKILSLFGSKFLLPPLSHSCLLM